MSAYSDIHVDDVGTEFLATVLQSTNGVIAPLDVSVTLSKQVIIKKPDGVVLVKQAVFTPITSGATGTGSDGKISYFSAPGDLDLPGTYRIQMEVTTAQGKWSSTIDKFKVLKNLRVQQV